MTGYRTHTANTSTAAPTGHPRALCRDDLDLHFPIGTGPQHTRQIAEAKALCRRCPLTTACLRWSLDHREPYGVWGGVCEDERAQLLRNRNRSNDDRPAPPERLRTLAAAGYSDTQIAGRLGHPWTGGRVTEARQAAGIRAGRYARETQTGRVA
jgi:WhiB family redox-sensing transcriptional regulator